VAIGCASVLSLEVISDGTSARDGSLRSAPSRRGDLRWRFPERARRRWPLETDEYSL